MAVLSPHCHSSDDLQWESIGQSSCLCLPLSLSLSSAACYLPRWQGGSGGLLMACSYLSFSPQSLSMLSKRAPWPPCSCHPSLSPHGLSGPFPPQPSLHCYHRSLAASRPLNQSLSLSRLFRCSASLLSLSSVPAVALSALSADPICLPWTANQSRAALLPLLSSPHGPR